MYRAENAIESKNNRKGLLIMDLVESMRHGICEVCGKPFIDTTRNRNKKYCSHSCHQKAAMARKNKEYEPVPETEFTCTVCGGKFKSRSRGVVMYCSDKCRNEGYARWRKAYREKHRTERPLCRYCGKHRCNVKGSDVCGYCRKALKAKKG